MAQRAFAKQTIQAGGTPQPLVGTWVTTTTAPATPGFDGTTLTSVPVNSSAMFKVGDYAYFVDTGLTLSKTERVIVLAIPDGTHIKVKNLSLTRTGGSFGTGDFVALSIAVNSVFVQQVQANAGNLFVGLQGLSKSTGANVIAVLVQFAAGTQPVNYSDTRYYGPNPTDSSDMWIDGTTSDGYQASFGVA